MLRDGQLLFTYLHLAPDPDQARELIASRAICVAYETVSSPAGGLPLLAPMSEVAGRMACRPAPTALSAPPAAWASCSAAWPACRRRAS